MTKDGLNEKLRKTGMQISIINIVIKKMYSISIMVPTNRDDIMFVMRLLCAHQRKMNQPFGTKDKIVIPKSVVESLWKATKIILVVVFTIGVWRGVWNLWDFYLFPDDVELSSWISIIVGFIIVFVLSDNNLSGSLV